MRTREEIEKAGGEGMELILEVLLDIRDLLVDANTLRISREKEEETT